MTKQAGVFFVVFFTCTSLVARDLDSLKSKYLATSVTEEQMSLLSKIMRNELYVNIDSAQLSLDSFENLLHGNNEGIADTLLLNHWGTFYNLKDV